MVDDGVLSSRRFSISAFAGKLPAAGAFHRTVASSLDRVGALGENGSGHRGCVNALSWADDGELLISSGDDTDIRTWRIDPAASAGHEDGYPFKCETVINTGHTQNVFNVQQLPGSKRIASVSGDKQVRVFDIGDALGRSPTGEETSYSTRQACVRVLRCHTGRTKRILTEDSPDVFLTVAEDGEVRQHDLRTFHSCNSGSCPAPLVTMPHELSTMAMSPLRPYHIVVRGESPFAYLFDRRHAGRRIQAEWGVPMNESSLSTCVRRFGRKRRAPGERRGYEHITGAKMSVWNGHELLLSYSVDGVYLYSTQDDTETSNGLRSPTSSLELRTPPLTTEANCLGGKTDVGQAPEATVPLEITDGDTDMVDEGDEDGEQEDDSHAISDSGIHKEIPTVYPRAKFTGHCNVETVKDVNFLGLRDEYVVSGSDDGNAFIWRKADGKLVDILVGDESVVNVVEGHPRLPLVAMSGIDKTVKLFAPVHGERQFSRILSKDAVIRRNASAARRPLLPDTQLLHLLRMHLEHAQDGQPGSRVEASVAQCINQ